MTPWSPPTLRTPPADVTLTPQQANVLTGICRGDSNADIGKTLFLSEDTVKTHARRLFAALGARNRTHAVALAYSEDVRISVRDVHAVPPAPVPESWGVPPSWWRTA